MLTYALMQAGACCCAQLVAGTNYAFGFNATYSCAPASASSSTQVNAIVYHPLPGNGNGAQVRLCSVCWP